jgi:intracellular septation protein
MPSEHAPAVTAQPSKPHGLIRALVDYGGPAAFVIAYFFRVRLVTAAGPLGWALAAGGHGPRDVTAATWWLVGGSALALSIGLIAERRIAPMPLIAGGFALVFGGLTLFFHDPRFVKIKPTATNLCFAAALFGGLALKKNPLKALLGESLPLPDEAWKKLTVRYGLFFLSMAGLNEWVWRTQSDAHWVLFRMPGLWILAVLFSFTQVPLMMKYMHSHQLPPAPTE